GTPQNPSFACLNAGPGAVGDECQPLFDSPSCGVGLLCVQLQGMTNGVCSPYCDPTDPAHACPSGVQCLPIGFQSPTGVVQTQVCKTEPGTGGGGAGGGAGTGGSGAGGSGGGGTGGTVSTGGAGGAAGGA